MLRYLLPLSLSASLIGCYDETADTTDPGTSADGTWTDENAGGDDGSTGDVGDEDDALDGERMALAQTDDPCAGSAETVLEFDSTGDLFAGCGDDEGLYVLGDGTLDAMLEAEGSAEGEGDGEMGEMDDGGEGSFELVSALASTSVYNLSYDSSGDDGSLLISSSSSSSYVLSFLYQDEDGSSSGSSSGSVTFDTSFSFSYTSDVEYTDDSCRNEDGESFSISGDNETLLWTSSVFSGSSDDWEAENQLVGYSVSNLMYSITSDSYGLGDCFGAGESEDGSASIFSEGDFNLSGATMSTIELDEEGYFNDIESGSEGMVAVGLDTANDVGLAYSCEADCDLESSWDELDLDLSLDGSGEGEVMGEINDIDFDNEDGTYGIIVGDLSGSASGSASDDGGFAMVTTDGGLTWETVTEDLPSLDSGSIDDEGNFAVSGAGDFVAVGQVSDYSSDD